MKVVTWMPGNDALPDSDHAPKLRAEIDRAFQDLKDAKCMIVDIRGNSGGQDWLCSYFASHFVKGPFPFYVIRNRRGDRFANEERVPADFGAFPGLRFDGPVYILIDNCSFSASDTFAFAMHGHIPDRVKLIGRPSQAGVGGPANVGTLRHTGLGVTVSTCKAFDHTGKHLLEGKPLAIDFPVNWSRADVIEDRDPDIAKALEVISKGN
jgi:C-terminal processing protease CtpA/Prc